MLSYLDLKNRFDGRAKHRNERKLSDHSFYVYDGGDGALHLQHCWNYKLESGNTHKYAGPVAKVWPHGEIHFTPWHSIQNNYRSTCEANLLIALTNMQVGFERTRSLKQLGWAYYAAKPLSHARFLCSYPVNADRWVAPGTVVLRRQGDQWIFGSKELVPMREWTEKRGEYIENARALAKNLELRARIGAFNPIAKDPTPLWKCKTPSVEASVNGADVNDHESLKPLVINAIKRHLYWSDPMKRDEATIARVTTKFVKSNRAREALRRKHGAVRYTTGV